MAQVFGPNSIGDVMDCVLEHRHQFLLGFLIFFLTQERNGVFAETLSVACEVHPLPMRVEEFLTFLENSVQKKTPIKKLKELIGKCVWSFFGSFLLVIVD